MTINNTSPSNFIYQSAHTLFTKGILLFLGFAASILLARFLGPNGRGALALFLVFPGLIMPLVSMGIRQSMAHFLGQKKYDENIIYENMLALFFINSFFAMLIVGISYSFMGLFNKYGCVIAVLFLVALPLELFRNYSSGLLIAKKHIEKLNKLALIHQITYIVMIVLLLTILQLSLLGVICALLAAHCLSFVLIAHWTRSSIVFKPLLSRVAKEMLLLGLIYALALFVLDLNYRIDTIMLGTIKGEYSVGIYSVGVSISELLKQLPLASGLVLFSRAVNWKQKDSNVLIPRVATLTRVLFAITAVCALIIIASAKWVLPFLYGHEYTESVVVIWLLIPGIVVLSIFMMLQFFTSGQGKPQFVIYAFIPGLFINIIMNLLLIPKWDYCGAAMSSTVSYIISTILYICIINSVFHTSFRDFTILRKSDFKMISGYLRTNK